MLSSASFSRSAQRLTSKVVVTNIGGEDWLGINKKGQSVLACTGSKIAASATDLAMMTLAACPADEILIHYKNEGRKVRSLSASIEGDISTGPTRFSEFRLKFEGDVEGVSNEDINKLGEVIVKDKCFIANTLKGMPKITARGVIKSSK